MALDSIAATVSSVSGSASAVTLAAANSARRGLSIHNDSTSVLYVKCGSSATSSDRTVVMEAGAHYELPEVIGRAGSKSVYSGIVTGVWASATGSAAVMEYT